MAEERLQAEVVVEEQCLVEVAVAAAAQAAGVLAEAALVEVAQAVEAAVQAEVAGAWTTAPS